MGFKFEMGLCLWETDTNVDIDKPCETIKENLDH